MLYSQLAESTHWEDENLTLRHFGHEMILCDYCAGEGSHALGGEAIHDWNEWDPDERDFYMSGGYDSTCEMCKGTGRLRIAVGRTEAAQKFLDEQEAYDRESYAIQAAERAAGC